MKRRSLARICGLFAIVLLGASAAVHFERQKVASLVGRTVLAWEEDLARDLLKGETGPLSKKIMTQFQGLHPALASVSFGEASCALAEVHEVSLYSVPAGRLHACLNPLLIFGGGLLSPLFSGFLLLVGTLGLFVLRRENLLERARLEAESRASLQKEKADLARGVAHDIRGPLSALKILVSSDRAGTAEGRELLIEASRRIEGIAEGLLEKSRDGAAVSLGLCFPQRVVERLGKEFSLRFPDCSVIVDSSLKGTEAIGWSADTLERALSNLVQNAVEASPTDMVVRVYLRRQSGWIVLTVVDEGVGMPSSLLARLGREEISVGKSKGNGLALKQLRRWVETAGGRWAIQSREGRGTRVEIRWPQLFAPAEAPLSGTSRRLQ